MLKNNGTVYGWGHNNFGQLGIGTFEDSYKDPVKVLYLKNVKKISAPGNSAFAIGEGPDYPADLFIPAVARAEGWNETKWKRDLYIDTIFINAKQKFFSQLLILEFLKIMFF